MNKTNPYQKKNTRWRLAFGCVLLPIIMIVAAAYFANNWYRTQVYEPVGSQTEFSEIIVDQGDTLFDIAPALVAENLLSNTDVLRIYVRLNEPELNLQAGTYRISGGKNIPQLIERLNAGPVVKSVTITIPEGWRYDEVADRLAQAFEIIEEARFSKSEYINLIENPESTEFSAQIEAFLNKYKPQGKNLEGFIFPDTYVFGTDASTKQVLELQLSNFIKRLEDNDLDPENVGRADNFYNALILASIVEREAGPKPEKPTVADIFLKRYEQNTLLGADATVLYKFKDWKRALTIADLEDTSNPYNTRALPGLTPTPISNPGINAIKAVLEPATTPYYYFITGNDGRNYYAETFSQHSQNIANYLQ